MLLLCKINSRHWIVYQLQKAIAGENWTDLLINTVAITISTQTIVRTLLTMNTPYCKRTPKLQIHPEDLRRDELPKEWKSIAHCSEYNQKERKADLIHQSHFRRLSDQIGSVQDFEQLSLKPYLACHETYLWSFVNHRRKNTENHRTIRINVTFTHLKWCFSLHQSDQCQLFLRYNQNTIKNSDEIGPFS